MGQIDVHLPADTVGSAACSRLRKLHFLLVYDTVLLSV
jgi:hypothetical protein